MGQLHENMGRSSGRSSLPTLLEAADDGADEATLDTVGLDGDEAAGC